jgi:hypothetical protein
VSDKKPAPIKADDLRSDGWQRFERAVDAAVKSGPKHRPSKPAAEPAKKKGG